MTPAMKTPVMPLLASIAATMLAILVGMLSFVFSLADGYMFMQIVSCTTLSIPLPIVLLAVYRKGPAEDWAKPLEILAVALLTIQGASILTMFLGNIVFMITEEYPQWLYYLTFIPGTNLLYDMMDFFGPIRYGDGLTFWTCLGMFYNVLRVAAEALFVLSTVLVVLACRKARKAQEPVDPWNQRIL